MVGDAPGRCYGVVRCTGRFEFILNDHCVRGHRCYRLVGTGP